MTQIYKPADLAEIWGEKEAKRLKERSVSEVILALGKSSGKDYVSTIAVCRIVYLLLCLKDPAVYYGKPSGDFIDILNIAINAKQAQNVFFTPLLKRIHKCPWFDDKVLEERRDEIVFIKSVRCGSGHSEKESFEGYNLMIAILDEISGFALESTSGNEQAKTASSIYDMYKGSVQSRFAKYGKTILLSFPRFRGDFITTRYEEVIDEKETYIRSHKFKLRDELPDGMEGNEFEIEWEEDHVITYLEPRVFALKRPNWYVNPTVEIEDFKVDFFRNPTDALMRFACMPPESIDAFFKDKAKVQRAFLPIPAPYQNGRFLPSFKPIPGAEYYMHVDLAYKHDRAALALAHVDRWVDIRIGEYRNKQPHVTIDLVHWWEPREDQSVDFAEIKNYILMLRSMGFNIVKITFDQWQSIDISAQLTKAGMRVEKLSVQKPEYEELAMGFAEERVKCYHIELLEEELLALRIIKGNKVDHPRKGSNDIADAMCGAFYNAVQHARPDDNQTVIKYLTKPQITHEDIAKERKSVKASGRPSREMQAYIQRMRAI